MSAFAPLSQRVLAEKRCSVGWQIREVRKSRRMTQQDVADRLGWTRTSLVAIERGQQAVTLDQLLNLAELFEVFTSRFFVHLEPFRAPPCRNCGHREW